MRFLAPLLVLTGCGYVGDVQPPALNMPQTIVDLQATQRGDKLRLYFTLPKRTTEGLVIREFGEIELRTGLPPDAGFDINTWAPTAKRVPAEASKTGVILVDAAVGEFAGREVYSAVRTSNPKGRWSAWSQVVTTQVVKPMPKPANIKAAAVKEGVRVTWEGDPAASYRIFRQADKEEDLSLVTQVEGLSYTDEKAETGKPYRYQVQGAQKVGQREAESDLSEVADITPVDTFAPDVPSALNLLVGVSSVELSWERNLEKDFRGYNVFRAVGDGPMEKIASLIESPAYSDKMVEPGKTYRYAISSVDQTGNESERSLVTTITVRQ